MMRYLIVIPARGGSKGIPLKNIYPVNGKPLIEYTIEAAIKSDINGDIAVSSDSEEILNVASQYKNVALIKRPDNISNDIASTEDALVHAINYMHEMFGNVYDGVITLQPTSPLRKADTINSFVKEFEKVCNIFDAQLTLTSSYSDYWVKDSDGSFQRLFPEAPRRRQGREPLYIENSAIYLTKTDRLIQTHSVLGTRVNGFLISEIEGIDINEYNDIRLAEYYLKEFI